MSKRGIDNVVTQAARNESSTMTRNTLLFTLTLTLALWSSHATAQDVSRYDRFQLFNECGPMNLLVEDYKDHAGWADIGLTVDRLQTMAESRLRAARLYGRHGGELPVRQRERCG